MGVPDVPPVPPGTCTGGVSEVVVVTEPVGGVGAGITGAGEAVGAGDGGGAALPLFPEPVDPQLTSRVASTDAKLSTQRRGDGAGSWFRMSSPLLVHS